MDKLKKALVLGWNWKLVVLLLAFAVPSLAYAQDFGGLEDLAIALGNIVQTLIPILVGIALLVFLWGVVKFIYNAGDEEARAQGKYVIFWGLLALFVIVFVWGLVTWIAESLNIDFIESMPAPTVEDLGE